MIPDAYSTHASPGRLRIKIPSRKNDAGWFAECKRRLEASTGVTAIEVSPLTGSVLIHHHSDPASLAEQARSAGLFALHGRPDGPLDIRGEMRKTVHGMDRAVRGLSEGRLDLGGLGFLALMGAGIFNLAAGEAGAIPWFVAFWYASEIFRKFDAVSGRTAAAGKE